MKSIVRTVAICLVLLTAAVYPVAAQPPHTEITIVSVDGTTTTEVVIGSSEWTGYNYTVEAASIMGISVNFTEDPNWGWYLNDLFGITSSAAWGEAGYWYWGLFEKNGTDWEASSVGVDQISVGAYESYAWAPTMDGTWIDNLEEELAGPQFTEITIVSLDGTATSEFIQGEWGWTGYNYTVEAASVMNISANLTEDPNWGWYLNDLFGATSSAAWGEPGYWYWGLFHENGTNWEATSVGVGQIEVGANQSYAWAPTTDGTWIDNLEAELAGPQETQISITSPNGTYTTALVEGEWGWTGYDYTVEAANILNISSNFTEDPNWGWFLNDLFGATSDAAWGDADYWYWGLFEQNATTGAWTATPVGMDMIEVGDTQRYAWAPTLDGTWIDPNTSSLEDKLSEVTLMMECEQADYMIGLDDSGLAFNVTSLSIQPGESVCWTWTDASMPHNIAEVDNAGFISYNGGVRSGDAQSSVTFIHTFSEDATFHYVCEPHASVGMAGEIVVGDGGVVVTEETEVVEETPGFTTVTMVIALLAAVLLARRKD